MLAKVVVVPPEEFEARVAAATKLEQGAGESKADFGQRVYKAKGCDACHTTTGDAKVGPTFKGIWGRKEALSDGSSVTVDENYVRNSILNPNGQIVAGYAPQMPSFAGQISDDQIDALIVFMKTLK